MAIDIAQLFNEKLPAALTAKAADAKAIGAKFQLNITGTGSWNIDLASDAPSCKAGEGAADVTITVAADDFQKLVENPGAGMQLFFAGKLKVQGNQMLAMKLQKLFDLVK